jgi:hypothetical protein
MRTLEVKGIKVHVEDEELEKALAEPEPEPEITEEDATLLLKELEEWLTAGRLQVLNKASKELRKQMIVGVGDAAPQIPRGAGAVGPAAAGVSSGVVAAPNLPAWLSGSPQAQAAAQQIAVANMVEALVGQLAPVLEEFAAKLAEWVSSVAEGLFKTISEVAEKIAAAQEKLGEKMGEVVERLESVAEKLPAAEGALEEGVVEELPPLPEEVAPAEETPSPAPEGAAPVGEGGEVPPAPEAGEVAPPPEEEAKAMPAASDVSGVLFSPQFLAAFARHLSQMTKNILEAQARKAQTPTETLPKPQSAFEIAEVVASSIRKGNPIIRIERDMTAPVETAKAPEGKGAKVAEQIEGAAKDEEVKKHLKGAARKAGEG